MFLCKIKFVRPLLADASVLRLYTLLLPVNTDTEAHPNIPLFSVLFLETKANRFLDFDANFISIDSLRAC